MYVGYISCAYKKKNYKYGASHATRRLKKLFYIN